MRVCIESCWISISCPDCGNSLPPAGRSYPVGTVNECCSKHQNTKLNQRHLWNKHDSDRAYTDPEGWENHLKECDNCRNDNGKF